MRILVIEDERKLAQAIKENIKKHYIVDLSFNGESGFYQATINDYDLIILDVGLPDINGFDVCKKIRSEDISSPILILTAYDEVKYKIKGLDIGADDYLTKPFSLSELKARIRALLRRKKQILKNNLQIKNVRINLINKTVSYKKQLILLNRKEYMLLEFLMRHKNQVVTRSMIIDHIWDQPTNLLTNTVEVHVNRLRNKIDKIFNIKFIKTIYRLGYKIECN